MVIAAKQDNKDLYQREKKAYLYSSIKVIFLSL